MIPAWLHFLSMAALAVGFLCAAVVVADETRDPQNMWIMNVVWPVVALFGGPLILWLYFGYGRLGTRSAAMEAKKHDEEPPNKRYTPFSIMAAKGSCHCGSGCTLGDICAEWLTFAVPTIAVWLGWKGIFRDKIFADWILDFILAFAFGIAFQYFTIVPMRGLKPLQGIWAAVKADTLSLTSWQLGMYGFMAFANFYIFRTVLGARLEVNSFEFWFMMQIAMLFGFATSYPVNWWLISKGLKEKM